MKVGAPPLTPYQIFGRGESAGVGMWLHGTPPIETLALQARGPRDGAGVGQTHLRREELLGSHAGYWCGALAVVLRVPTFKLGAPCTVRKLDDNFVLPNMWTSSTFGK